ncbi:hypothetical protein ANCCAN_05432 [Ancylostoma caninum]|uniref:MADF domain-containing protein n=1 Tax=Ancylostoma caninum TaxID=29170 RepID=A0A368GZK1_ANCCA|nr:hypothetical protein ANCCAN_05432 [Ancylostoma caninum]
MSYDLKCELISEVEEEECLWNPRNEDYHKTDKRGQAWIKIQNRLERKGYQTDLLALKMYWKNLRDHWRRRQNPTTGSAAQKPWPFSERLQFLIEGEAQGVRFSHLNLQSAPQGTSRDSGESFPPLASRKRLGSPTHPHGPARKKPREVFLERGLSCMEETSQLLRERFGGNRGNDRMFQPFGDTVATVLGYMPLHAAHERMAELSAILFKPFPGCDGGSPM